MPDPESDAKPARGWLAALVAVALVAIAVWEIVTIRRARATPDEDWAAAATLVRERYRPGDLIVFAPGWADPIGRLHLGDLIPIDYAARMDTARFARIWELSIRGARAPDVDRTPVETLTAGGVTIRRYEQTPPPIVADLRTLLSTVRLEGGRRPTLELAEIGFEPRRCIQVIPDAGKTVRVTFPALPAGTLVGYAGLADIFTRRDIRRPGRLIVEIDGRAVTEIAPGIDDGWVPFATEIPGGDVTIVASADAPNRQLCFAAEVRR